ncbi:hypothetical protein EV648_118106 [Kribbella sp. VKM Ac-2568]|nr:hypothetical protein EV648_118106 [Kribbella sp. VKM Ac-2568]
MRLLPARQGFGVCAGQRGDFLADLRSRDQPISLTTLRAYSNSVAMFCAYLTHQGYGWGEFCERTFGDVPSQICFEWNTTVPIRRVGPAPRLSAEAQDKAIQRVVYTTELTARNRTAAILVLVFAQRVEKISKLTWDDAEITDEIITVRIGQTSIGLPEPLDQPFRQLATTRSSSTAAHPTTNWMFPGLTPGRHIRPRACVSSCSSSSAPKPPGSAPCTSSPS